MKFMTTFQKLIASKAPHKNLMTDQKGFTLTEMLVVIALIGMVMAFVASNIAGKFAGAKVNATKITMRNLGNILDQFRLDCGFYPLTDQGLEALGQKPAGRDCKNYDPEGYVKGGKVPQDGWNNDFTYTSDGGKYELKSLGQDAAEGGEGNDKDLTSNDL